MINGKKGTVLVGKDCFYAWLETGSLDRAANRINPNINTRTERRYTRNGVRLAALHYLAENVDNAKQAMINHGDFSGDEEFYDYTIQRVIGVLDYRGIKLGEWLKRWNIAEHITQEKMDFLNSLARPEPVVELELEGNEHMINRLFAHD